MTTKKQDFDLLTEETRNRLQTLRDAAKQAGISNSAFYQNIMQYMAPYGTHASATWIREQCDPDNITPPSLRKLYALKQALDEYEEQTDLPTTVDGAGDMPQQDSAPRTMDLDRDEVGDELYAEGVEGLGKTILEKPTKAVLIIADLLNSTIRRHTEKHGNLTPLITYLRTRVDFSHDITLSNMPIHTLRNIRTIEHAKNLNPSFKTLAALAHVLVTINTANFPWGDDDALEETTKDMVAEKKGRGPRNKKYPSLAEQNKALIMKAQGTHVLGKKLTKRT